MIAPNEDALAAGSGETTPPINNPASIKPRWNPGQALDGSTLPPGMYARFGETPWGLIDWARVNEQYLGIPGAYNAAVLMQAAGTMRALQDDLKDIKACLSILRRVLDGESLQNESVKAEFREAIEVIETSTVHVEIVAIATNATPQDAA